MTTESISPLPQPEAAPGTTVPAVQIPTFTLPSNVQMTNFEDESIKQFEFDQYKGKKGYTDRIGILLPSNIAIGRIHFKQDGDAKGYVLCQSEIRAQGGTEVVVKQAICCEKLKEPKKRFGVLVVQYRTDRDGNLVQPFGYDLKVWVFGVDKYVELRSLNREFPLGKHDLKLACTDENFQKLTIQACRESVASAESFRKQFGQHVDEWTAAMVPKLPKALGKVLNAEELTKFVGSAAPAANVVADAPAIDVAELLK